MNRDTLVTVAAIVHNNASVLKDILGELHSVCSQNYSYYEILLLDNHSDDSSHSIIAELSTQLPNIRYIRLSRCYDREIAVAAILDHCIGDYIVLLDPLCDPPGRIPDMVNLALSGHDIVIGIRDDNTQRGYNQWVRKYLYKGADWALGVHFDPNESAFQLFNRQVLNSLTRIRNSAHSFRYHAAAIGFKRTYFHYTGRVLPGAPEIKSGLLKSIDTGTSLVVANSALPLLWASYMGAIASLLSIGFSLYVIAAHIVKGKSPEGWMTSNLMMTSLFFILFIIMSVLSRYIACIIETVRDYPQYFVESEAQSSVISYKQTTEQDGLNIV